EVATEHAVARANAWRSGDHAWRDELVGLAGLVGGPDRGQGIWGWRSHAMHHRIVRELGALPALIAVHRVVPTDDGGNDRDSGFGTRDSGPTTPEPRAPGPESLQQLFHESQSGGRPRIAPVEPGVDRHGQVVSPPEFNGREQMLVQRMDPAGPDQPDEVQRAAALSCSFTQLDERGQAEELAGLHGLRDAHDVLRDHAAGAEVQVTHLAAADLSLGESNGELRCGKER